MHKTASVYLRRRISCERVEGGHWVRAVSTRKVKNHGVLGKPPPLALHPFSQQLPTQFALFTGLP